MDAGSAGIPMVMAGPTYPFELFNDAKYLRDQAKSASGGRDHRNIPTPTERAFSRAAIFTAFNFLESLLIDLAQEHVTNGPGRGTSDAATLLDDLKEGRTKISKTMKEWTLKFAGGDITADHRFTKWKVIRGLRNQLVHPKLEPLDTDDLTQDQLLRRANADEAAWVVGQICGMAEALYSAFGQPVLPEVATEAAAARRFRPAQL